MTRAELAAELVDGVRAGDTRALARAISLVEDGDPAARELVAAALSRTPATRTRSASPGRPASASRRLISALVAHVRARGRTVGVISVDPSSPFTQGALLGDRIRLAEHFLDPGVFIRSMGTRGHAGGLAEATLQALLLLDASGKDVVFLETVGTGQSEIGVLSIADTVVLALMPGSGDSVQALKAGIMEIPDVIAINKLDHPQARRRANDVRQVLALGAGERAADRADRGAARRGDRRAAGPRSRRTGPGSRRTATLEERRAPQPRGRGVRGRLGTGAPTSGECGRRRPRARAAARPGARAGSSIR